MVKRNRGKCGWREGCEECWLHQLQKKDEGADHNTNSDGYRENRREIGSEKRESVKER